MAISNKIYKKALIILKAEDIEDGLQITCCLENNVDLVVTSDGSMYAKYGKKIDIQLVD